jgi:hypothetical protein
MKTIEIGKKEFKMYETAEDLPVYRYKVLKEFIIYKESNIDKVSLVNAIRGFVYGFDTDSKSQMLISLQNYLTGLEQDDDSDQMIFALITLESDEDESRYDSGFLREKIDRFSKLGLTQKLVEEEVANFIKGSKAHFVSYFQKSLASLAKTQ